MSKIKVGVAGYGVIGQRLADGVARQGDMELVGVADLAPTLSIRALKEQGMPYDLYLVDGADKSQFDACGIPVSGTFEELIDKVDIMLDSSPGGVGAKNKELYVKHNTKAIFQGGEKNSVADVFFQEVRCPFGNVTMRRAVRTVFPHRVFLVELVRQRVHVRLRGKRLIERRIEHGNHGRFGHMVLTSPDSHDGCFVVKRCELCHLVDFIDDVLVDDNGTVEILSALDDAVPNRINLIERVDGLGWTAGKRFKDQHDSCIMIGHGHFFTVLVATEPEFVDSMIRTDAVAKTLREQLLRFNFDELILERGRTCVDDEHVHGVPFERVYSTQSL